MVITLFNLMFGDSTGFELLTIETETFCGSLFSIGYDSDVECYFCDLFFMTVL